MANISQQILEDEERDLLKEQMLEPEQLFLLEFLKNANRKAAQKLQYVYGWDIQTDEY